MSVTETEPKTWITGEEYAAEWKRLREARAGIDSPERQALMRRVDERNEYLWRTFGLPLVAANRGRWAAIGLDGEVILDDSDPELSEKAQRRFGPGGYALRNLDDRGAAICTGPRLACRERASLRRQQPRYREPGSPKTDP
jgi:hypothetical protein